jgi:glutamine amidotransferase-like uncharacterized protein
MCEKKLLALAGVCSRTVGNGKVILKKAHPSVVEALHNGTITINAAMEVCKFDRILQVEELARMLMKRSNNKLIASTSISYKSNNSVPI